MRKEINNMDGLQAIANAIAILLYVFIALFAFAGVVFVAIVVMAIVRYVRDEKKRVKKGEK